MSSDEGELKKRLIEFALKNELDPVTAFIVLDEAKKEFYKIINEDVPEDKNDPENLYELLVLAVEKWFGSP